MELRAEEIHLWVASYDEARCRALYPAYRAMLSDAEKEQERRFRFARDRSRYLVTRALVRTVLSQYLPVAPMEWAFSVNEYGRPDIANPQALAARLSFNVSHTDGLILLGVSRNRTVGVDVENVRTSEISIDVADRFFAPCETRALRVLPAHRQRFRFFEYWTLKESYIKARGMGLSIPLDEFWFDLPHDRNIQLTCAAALGDETQWQFWQPQLPPEYLAAVCAEARETTTRFIVRRAVPLDMQEELAVTWSRVS